MPKMFGIGMVESWSDDQWFEFQATIQNPNEKFSCKFFGQNGFHFVNTKLLKTFNIKVFWVFKWLVFRFLLQLTHVHDLNIGNLDPTFSILNLCLQIDIKKA